MIAARGWTVERLAVALGIAAALLYGALAFSLPGAALDNDMLSLALAWKLIGAGVVLDESTIATPNPLLVLVDGVLWQAVGTAGIVARSVLMFGALVACCALQVGQVRHGFGLEVFQVLFASEDQDTLRPRRIGHPPLLWKTAQQLGLFPHDVLPFRKGESVHSSPVRESPVPPALLCVSPSPRPSRR